MWASHAVAPLAAHPTVPKKCCPGPAGAVAAAETLLNAGERWSTGRGSQQHAVWGIQPAPRGCGIHSMRSPPTARLSVHPTSVVCRRALLRNVQHLPIFTAGASVEGGMLPANEEPPEQITIGDTPMHLAALGGHTGEATEREGCSLSWFCSL